MTTQATDRMHASFEAGKVRRPLRVAIVGGGITGLSTAWYLEKYAADHGIDLDYTVLEASQRWGGKIRTEYVTTSGGETFVIEAGPDSFLTQKPWALRLAQDLGLDDRLLDTNDAMRQVYVVKRGRLTPLPDGVLLIIPTKIMPFVRSSLISFAGKLRMGLDLLIPPKRDDQDETIAEFVERRLGAEAVDRLAEPLMSGIYNAEADRQSILATFPRFRALEKEYGSLIRGMLASRRANRGRYVSPSGKKRAMFVSLRGGTEELVKVLVSKLTGALRLNAAVHSIKRTGSGYTLSLSDEQTLKADQIILTTPAYVTAELLGDIAPGAASVLAAIRYVSTGTLTLAYHSAGFDHPLDGFGLVIPRSEGRRINAVTWTSTKFDHRAPEGHVLLRVFFGGSRRPEMMDKNDEQLLAIAQKELYELMGISSKPILHQVYRWRESNPQYDVGHLTHIDTLEASLPPNLHVTGSPCRGIGIPDCVRQGQETAQRMIQILTEKGG